MAVIINDWNDLGAIGGNAEYKLAQDLDSSTTGYTGTGDSWTPIENFYGVIDGDGHTISDLTIDGGTRESAFIGILESGGAIKNLGFINASLSTTGDDFFASIAVATNNGKISNCFVDGSVDAPSYSRVALLTAEIGPTASIYHSYASGSVTGDELVGGFVGDSNAGARIESCYASVSVSSTTSEDPFINSSGGVVKNGYFDSSVYGGTSTGSDATPLTTSEMSGDSAKTNMSGFNYERRWSVMTSGTTASADGYPILRSVEPDIQASVQAITFNHWDGLDITGTVTLDGTAVSGADVTVESKTSEINPSVLRDTTDGNGNYAVYIGGLQTGDGEMLNISIDYKQSGADNYTRTIKTII